MASTLEQLREFVRTPCAFWCTRAGEVNTPKEERFLARVVHRLNRPATSIEMWELRSVLGRYAPQIEAVYAEHNGFVLYQDCLSDAAGVESLSIRAWPAAAEKLRNWLSDFVGDNDKDHILGGVPFARVPHSGNYFVIPVDGPSAGKIFYADHDGWYDSAFAADFNDFVQRITTEPATLISEELGSCTRYSDGSSNTQWIPRELAIEPGLRR
jgi:hypothetical protein